MTTFQLEKLCENTRLSHIFPLVRNRNTSVERLGEREVKVKPLYNPACKASASFHDIPLTYGNVFNKKNTITRSRRKLKRRNSFLYQNVNSQYILFLHDGVLATSELRKGLGSSVKN